MQKFTVEQVRDYYRNYSPNATLVIVGDFETEPRSAVKEIFGKVPKEESRRAESRGSREVGREEK